MSQLFRLIAYLFRSSKTLHYPRALVAVLILAGIVAGLSSTALIAVVSVLIGDPAHRSSTYTWVFVGLCLALPLSRFVSQYLLVRLAQQITYNLRVTLCSRILAAPLRQLERLGPSRLLATLTDDVTVITVALTTVPLLFLQISVVLSCLVLMGWLSWQMLLVVLAAVLIGVGTYQLPLLGALKHFSVSRNGWDRMVKGFRGVTDGTKELKIHRERRAAFLRQEIEETAGLLRFHNVRGNAIYAVVNSWGQALFFVVIGIVLFVVPQFWALSPRVLSGYVLAILYMMTPLDVILNSLPEMGRAVIAIDRIESLGLTPEATADQPASRRDWQSLELRGVAHTYFREDMEDNFTLGPIDLAFKPGELVFLVGGNGSGKTTLAKLLVGLYDCEMGGVYLDGEKVTEANLESYRSLFSVVFSDFFLFESLLGMSRIDEQATQYLEQLHLNHKVRVENGTLSTIELSQGQRKRLALLTAYLEDRPIYLFDEWASDQDPQFKRLFYRHLLPDLRRRGRTVFVISHDDHYYDVADRIVKLEYGRVDEDSAASRSASPAIASEAEVAAVREH